MIDEPVSVTTWPGGSVSVPDLARYPEAELDGEFIWLNDGPQPGHVMAPPPAEIYLRQARQLDLDNPGPVVLDVVRNVGGVLIPGTREFSARDLPQRDHAAMMRWSAMHGRRWEEPDFVAGRGYRIHVDDVAYRLRLLDVLGRHAVAYQRNDYLAPVWEAALTGPRKPRDEKEAWLWFAMTINPALSNFHVRVEVLFGDGHRPVPLAATVLEAGALQIVNDLADAVDYLTCPHCKQVFARSVGGSTHFSRSTGVTYCSPRCATNARVRAYRERKRAKKGNSAG